MNRQTSSQKIVVIFPAKNEEDTIEHVITTAKKSRYNPEVIVVDAYSSDATVEKAKKAGAKVIQQDDRMFPAKGIVMKKGLHEAISINADIILFLDADIKNLTPEWIDKLVEDCANCDMARGYYQRYSRCSGNKAYCKTNVAHLFSTQLLSDLLYSYMYLVF